MDQSLYLRKLTNSLTLIAKWDILYQLICKKLERSMLDTNTPECVTYLGRTISRYFDGRLCVQDYGKGDFLKLRFQRTEDKTTGSEETFVCYCCFEYEGGR